MVSHTVAATFDGSNREVLILIVMDNGLSRGGRNFRPEQGVLILIVMDNGLSQLRGRA